MGGWDYYTFLEQPQPFIDIIITRMQAEGHAKEYLRNKYGGSES